MTSKRIVYGKHPLTVRVDTRLYAKLRMIAAEKNLSVQELMIELCEREIERRKE